MGPSDEGRDFAQQEAGSNGAQMPFLAYLINTALEEANNEKNSRL